MHRRDLENLEDLQLNNTHHNNSGVQSRFDPPITFQFLSSFKCLKTNKSSNLTLSQLSCNIWFLDIKEQNVHCMKLTCSCTTPSIINQVDISRQPSLFFLPVYNLKNRYIIYIKQHSLSQSQSVYISNSCFIHVAIRDRD